MTIAEVGRKRRRTPTERKTQSMRMEEYWAAKRAKAEKTKKPTSSKPKSEKSLAGKAISNKMRIYEAKKKAKAAANRAKTKPSKILQKPS